MNYDYTKRGYLLPQGCKDLIDVLNLAGQTGHGHAGSPPVTQSMVVADPISVRELAVLVKRRPFQVIADLMALGIYAGLDQRLGFEAVSGLLRNYGILAKPMP